MLPELAQRVGHRHPRGAGKRRQVFLPELEAEPYPASVLFSAEPLGQNQKRLAEPDRHRRTGKFQLVLGLLQPLRQHLVQRERNIGQLSRNYLDLRPLHRADGDLGKAYRIGAVVSVLVQKICSDKIPRACHIQNPLAFGSQARKLDLSLQHNG